MNIPAEDLVSEAKEFMKTVVADLPPDSRRTLERLFARFQLKFEELHDSLEMAKASGNESHEETYNRSANEDFNDNCNWRKKYEELLQEVEAYETQATMTAPDTARTLPDRFDHSSRDLDDTAEEDHALICRLQKQIQHLTLRLQEREEVVASDDGSQEVADLRDRLWAAEQAVNDKEDQLRQLTDETELLQRSLEAERNALQVRDAAESVEIHTSHSSDTQREVQ